MTWSVLLALLSHCELTLFSMLDLGLILGWHMSTTIVPILSLLGGNNTLLITCDPSILPKRIYVIGFVFMSAVVMWIILSGDQLSAGIFSLM